VVEVSGGEELCDVHGTGLVEGLAAPPLEVLAGPPLVAVGVWG
jgi:hypothetical protein